MLLTKSDTDQSLIQIARLFKLNQTSKLWLFQTKLTIALLSKILVLVWPNKNSLTTLVQLLSQELKLSWKLWMLVQIFHVLVNSVSVSTVLTSSLKESLSYPRVKMTINIFGKVQLEVLSVFLKIRMVKDLLEVLKLSYTSRVTTLNSWKKEELRI